MDTYRYIYFRKGRDLYLLHRLDSVIPDTLDQIILTHSRSRLHNALEDLFGYRYRSTIERRPKRIDETT